MADSQIYMVAGLGNPGKEYTQTRHNMGFIVVEEIARRYELSFNNQSCFDAYVAKGLIEKKHTILVKPQSYMNRSGFPLQKLSSYFKIETDKIIVIHDEIDLPFGRLMIVKDRGHGGHNGIRSIIESFGSKNFIRIRIGVGRPNEQTKNNSNQIKNSGAQYKNSSDYSNKPNDNSVTDYVLGKFAGDEQKNIDLIVKTAADACFIILSRNLQIAINSFNSNNILNMSHLL